MRKINSSKSIWAFFSIFVKEFEQDGSIIQF